MSKETWKPIIGFENEYLVSNFGNVKGVNRTTKQINNGTLTNRHVKSKIISLFSDKDGYYAVSLYKKNKQYHKRVHRLVAEAFIPNYYNKPYVNHLNGIRNDNRVKNLEWVTAKENTQYSIKVLKIYIGSPVFTKVKKIDKNGDEEVFSSIHEAARFVKGEATNICKCCKKRRGFKTAYGFRWEYL